MRYYVALKEDLPGDKDRMISQLESVLAGSEPLKDEGLRML
jgi:hypothetical protein